MIAAMVVSIPGGFSGALRRQQCRERSFNHTRFQSLAGFLVHCDIAGIAAYLLIFLVSIPGGFSGALRHYPGTAWANLPTSFQSLAGFLVHCDEIRWTPTTA